MEYKELYFFTATIKEHKPLISQHELENTILNSLHFLHKRSCLKIYGFVIMPNHIHLIWQLLQPNGKESPVASFMKFTAHSFQKYLQQKHPETLEEYSVPDNSRKYNFWQLKSDWFLLKRQDTIIQKLNYIHFNPMQPHWCLVTDPVQYPFSSAKFYETGVNDFDFLYHIDDFSD